MENDKTSIAVIKTEFKNFNKSFDEFKDEFKEIVMEMRGNIKTMQQLSVSVQQYQSDQAVGKQEIADLNKRIGSMEQKAWIAIVGLLAFFGTQLYQFIIHR